MTLYLADEPETTFPEIAGTRPASGVAHHLLGPRTACGRTPGPTWVPVPWKPPEGCCKTCTAHL